MLTRKKLLLLLILICCLANGVLAQRMDIWIVRHGEKDKSDPEDSNPALSAEGRTRAEDLAVHLKGIKFNVAFSTPFKRTHQILEPLVKKNKIDIKDYRNTAVLADDILKNYIGKTIIIAGHSNTILEIIEAFGLKRPIERVTEEDYNYLFHIILNGDQRKVEIDKYGEKSG
ncbi:phosphoglycerate mutase family protein [Pedobacter antarcticus]|uniref:phosphoglycerate mutase family protein n=1 Tax=Pedobacter antarcticus TaxID=34086 RepID=UPI00088A7392|nr:phosphoglycerate mutase family protein [Pedobacter antarcticus]SDL69979.1 Histidine phosphatase superfamily (branch 1) [Pedobacter antarcticus]